MKTVYVKDFLHSTESGESVVLYGWVKSRRKHNRVVFIDVTDSTGTIQCVVESSMPNVFEVARRLNLETAVKICGILVDKVEGKRQKEIMVSDIEILGVSELDISPYPRSNIDIEDPRLQEQLLDKRHFYLRNEKLAAIIKFRHLLMRVVHQWFNNNGYIEIHAPVLTPTPLYDDSTAMSINVHGQDVYLTQCVGFYLEQSVHSFERIYNIGPSFRAEESRSKRHLMEYWHIKAEIAFVDSEDMISIVEKFISEVSTQCIQEGNELAEILETEICSDGVKIPFPRIDYVDAVNLLKSKGIDFEFGKSLGSEEESLLSEIFGNTPFWVVGIPRSIEPFPYVLDSADVRRTKTADLIASKGYGELLGIAEKIHTLAMLDERLKEKGKAGDLRYEWLRDLRQYGCVPHGGFGMGLERFIRWLLQTQHVRDTIPFHRVFGRRIDP